MPSLTSPWWILGAATPGPARHPGRPRASSRRDPRRSHPHPSRPQQPRPQPDGHSNDGHGDGARDNGDTRGIGGGVCAAGARAGLVDPTGTVVASAQNADLLYLQHIVISTTLSRCRRPADPAAGDPAAGDPAAGALPPRPCRRRPCRRRPCRPARPCRRPRRGGAVVPAPAHDCPRGLADIRPSRTRSDGPVRRRPAPAGSGRRTHRRVIAPARWRGDSRRSSVTPVPVSPLPPHSPSGGPAVILPQAGCARPGSVWATAQATPAAQRRGRYVPESSAHPAKMLPAVAAHAITHYTQPGELVLDPMCGIGTTLVEAVHARAARDRGRVREPLGADRPRQPRPRRARQRPERRAGDHTATPANSTGCSQPSCRAGRVGASPHPRTGPPPTGRSAPAPAGFTSATTSTATCWTAGNLANIGHHRLLAGFTRILTARRPFLRPGGQVVITVRPWREHAELIDLPAQIHACGRHAGLLPVERCVALLGRVTDTGGFVARGSFFQRDFIRRQRDARPTPAPHRPRRRHRPDPAAARGPGDRVDPPPGARDMNRNDAPTSQTRPARTPTGLRPATSGRPRRHLRRHVRSGTPTRPSPAATRGTPLAPPTCPGRAGPANLPSQRSAASDLLPLRTPAQAAQLLAVPESWLRRKAAARAIPCTFLGKHLRFSPADLAALATAAAQPPRTRARTPRRRPRTR